MSDRPPEPCEQSVKVTACDNSAFDSALGILGIAPADQASGSAERVGQQPEIEDILIAAVGDQIIGAVITQVAPGRVGWIWPPASVRAQVGSSIATEIGVKLVRAGAAKLAQTGCRLVQALLSPDEDRSRIFELSGFNYITEMIRMECDCVVASGLARVALDLKFEPFRPENRNRFEQVIRRTYEGSQDCPELDSVRSVAEVLDSYRASGEFRSDLWLLARYEGSEVGCVLQAYSPDEFCSELQYMGVVAAARGKRIGRFLCLRALEDARRIGARHMCLSVDVRNWPAIRHYTALRFIETARRRVYIWKPATRPE